MDHNKKPPWYVSEDVHTLNKIVWNVNPDEKYQEGKFNYDFNCEVSNFESINSNKKSKLKVTDFKSPKKDVKKETLRLQELLKKQILNINKSGKKNKTTHIKTAQTKSNKKISNINTIIRSYGTKININEDQKQILLNIMKTCKDVYNYAVDMYNNPNDSFNLDFRIQKQKVFWNYFRGRKVTNYDILTDEIKDLCANIKSCLTQIKNGNIKHFSVSHKMCKNKYSITIPKKSIYNNGFLKRQLKSPIKNFSAKIKAENIVSDCKLIYDKISDAFYFYCPSYIHYKTVNNRNKICGLDPGEKIFMTFFSESNAGMIGKDIRKIILKHEARIRQLQRILNRMKNKKGKKLRNKNRIIKRIQRKYRKIKNIVKELHNKTALFLCKNYDTILIPKFETQNLIKNKKIKRNYIKKNLEKIKTNSVNKKELKEKLKKYKRRTRLNGRVKFVLNQLSHYKFKQQLFLKGEEYGCRIIEVTEEYTSKVCGNCFKMSDDYNNRVKKCSHCNHTIDRDINGARNILLKNLVYHQLLR